MTTMKLPATTLADAKERKEGWSIYPPQDPAEFEALCGILRARDDITSILEVGSRHGRSLVRLAEACLPSLRSVSSIDLPGGAWGAEGSGTSLMAAVEMLSARVPDAQVFFGDSHSMEAASWARARGPFDLLFLDGDHSYGGVRSDWDEYSAMVAPGGLVALHDIAGDPESYSGGLRMGVPKLWSEICRDMPGQTIELVGKWSQLGIGVVLL